MDDAYDGYEGDPKPVYKPLPKHRFPSLSQMVLSSGRGAIFKIELEFKERPNPYTGKPVYYAKIPICDETCPKDFVLELPCGSGYYIELRDSLGPPHRADSIHIKRDPA